MTSFYQDDEYSRQMPGKKDCVSVGNGKHEQKRLVLCNLSEMHAAFKEKYPNVKVGFSKFCSLRPKWCVLAGSSGTHSVCVCSIHQNAILLVDAIDWDYTYKDLIQKVVCDPENKRPPPASRADHIQPFPTSRKMVVTGRKWSEWSDWSETVGKGRKFEKSDKKFVF